MGLKKHIFNKSKLLMPRVDPVEKIVKYDRYYLATIEDSQYEFLPPSDIYRYLDFSEQLPDTVNPMTMMARNELAKIEPKKVFYMLKTFSSDLEAFRFVRQYFGVKIAAESEIGTVKSFFEKPITVKTGWNAAMSDDELIVAEILEQLGIEPDNDDDIDIL